MVWPRLKGALAANPPWRREFLSRVVVNGANDRLMTQLYRSLIRSSQPPTAGEMKPYLDRLIQAGALRRGVSRLARDEFTG